MSHIVDNVATKVAAAVFCRDAVVVMSGWCSGRADSLDRAKGLAWKLMVKLEACLITSSSRSFGGGVKTSKLICPYDASD